MKIDIPREIKEVAETLQKGGFEAYLVGGCVRDLVLSEVEGLSHIPKDWDIATNAKPEEIQKLFPDTVYENNFGTVGVKVTGDMVYGARDEENKTIHNSSISHMPYPMSLVEVTTYRVEG